MPIQIITPRLALALFDPADLGTMTELVNDLELTRMMASFTFPFTKHDAKNWMTKHQSREADGNGHLFAIKNKDRKLAGIIGMDRAPGELFDLGYWVGKPFWGKGYASEAACALLRWAETELGIKAIKAGFYEDNPASARVLEKAGFLRTGERKMIHSKGRGCAARSINMIWLGHTGNKIEAGV